MATLRAIATEMVRKVPGDIFREESIASLTATTAVVTALAVGGWSNDKFASQFLWRPDSTTLADKSRYITAFTSSTGTFTHAGTNYADTTATGQKLIVSRVEPYIIRQAIDSAIRRLKTVDRTEMPMVNGQGSYSLGDLDWIRQPSDILRITYNHSPVITRNRYLQKRNSVNSSGVFLPDWWTVANNADATPFEVTNYRGQKYQYSLERSGGVNATLVQAVGALRSGVTTDSPVGETITAVIVFNPDTAADVLLTLTDGTTSATSTGSGSALQEASASITLAAAATEVTITVTAQTSNAAQKVNEVYALIGELTDAVRRDNYQEYALDRNDWDFDQNGVLTLRTPSLGRGQLLIYSKRPYPGFDATRLSTGDADADSTDAPTEAVVAGALSRIYFGLEGASSPNYAFWENEFSILSRGHFYEYASAVPQFLAPLAPRPRFLR